MQDNKTIQTTKRKSAILSPEEKKALRKFVNTHNTGAEAAESIGIHRNVLDRVLIVGSGAPESIELIRKAIAA